MESLLFQISSRFDTKYETDLMYTLNIYEFQLDNLESEVKKVTSRNSLDDVDVCLSLDRRVLTSG